MHTTRVLLIIFLLVTSDMNLVCTHFVADLISVTTRVRTLQVLIRQKMTKRKRKCPASFNLARSHFIVATTPPLKFPSLSMVEKPYSTPNRYGSSSLIILESGQSNMGTDLGLGTEIGYSDHFGP